MRIVSRYFLVNYARLFIPILAISTAAMAAIEISLRFDEITRRGEGVAAYLLLRLPSHYLRHLVPVSSFAAAFLCFGLPARRREITAIRSGGISPGRAALPVLAAAATLSAVCLLVNETWILRSAREWRRPEAATTRSEFRGESFWYHNGDVIYNVREGDPETEMLYGVRVFRLGPRGRLLESIRADRARVGVGDRWHLLDATVQAFDPADPEAPPLTRRLAETVVRVDGREDVALLEAHPDTLSLRRLGQLIDARLLRGRDAVRQRAQFHARLAEPLAVLLFAFLAIPLGLSVERSGTLAAPALQGAALVGLFYTIRMAASLLGAAGLAWTWASPWLELTAFGGWGAWRFARALR
ncbi:MAG: LptF/LptG family permease [Myxococcota bacterium]